MENLKQVRTKIGCGIAGAVLAERYTSIEKKFR